MAQATRSRKSSSSSKGSSPQVLKSINPRTGALLREIPATDPAEVKEIVAQARKVAPEWAAIPPEGRARMLREVRYRIHDLMDEIVETVRAESGKPRLEAHNHEVLAPIGYLLTLEHVARKALAPHKISTLARPLTVKLLSGNVTRIEWRPHGVVGAITPWNYPIMNCFLGFASALLAGNAVVIKPSEVTPQAGELMKKILEPLPSGVATVIQGGADVGAALVDAPVDKISFIGSPLTGRKICEAAAKHLTPVVMELGGKDAAIVCQDADVDLAAAGILWGSFFNAGQTCCSIERAYVVDAVADEFEEKLVSKFNKLRLEGDEPEMGPLTFPPQLDIVKRQLSDALDKGARVLAGGPEGSGGNGDGLWHPPTILTETNHEMEVLTKETFGPVLNVVRVRDEEEAVRRANEEGVNLTASVWTKKVGTGERVGARLRAGNISINQHAESPADGTGAWGGVGESGFGRLNGEVGLREFSVPVYITRSRMPMKRFWWYPYNEEMLASIRDLVDFYGAPTAGEKIRGLRGVLSRAGAVMKSKL